MKIKEKSTGNKPFSNLKALLKENKITQKLNIETKREDFPHKRDSKKSADINKQFEEIIKEPEVLDDSHLFARAVSDVAPLTNQNRNPKVAVTVNNDIKKPEDSKKKVLANLNKLVTDGIGFAVSDTPEYMEGIGYNVNPQTAKRLHRGDFSVQDHLDLHGHIVSEAHAAFDDFLRQSISSRKRSVLIIHGRGLSSPGEPILKKKVSEWLTTGQWRKWIVSFTSARPEDGGAGATYVLLRSKPVNKSSRKGKKIISY